MTIPKNAGTYWSVTIITAAIVQMLLAMYAYAPIYYSMVGEEWVMWIGAVGSAISAIVGVVMYGMKWSGVNSYPYDFRWYDYIVSQLTGLGFAIGFGVAFAVIALVVIVVMYILAFIFVIVILLAFLAGLGSC